LYTTSKLFVNDILHGIHIMMFFPSEAFLQSPLITNKVHKDHFSLK